VVGGIVKLLLDTHTLLWFVDASTQDHIPAGAQALIANTENELLVSAVTPWELSLKHWLGKLPEAGVVLAAWPQVIQRLRATVLPVTDTHGILGGQLDWAHQDPFDRMLAAQAILEDATLVSADTVFDAAPGVHRVW